MTQFCRHLNRCHSWRQKPHLKTEAATRASGLLVKFQHDNTYMALTLAEDTLGQLETLNRSLQSKKMTMSGVKAANDEMAKSLDIKRTSDHVIEASRVWSWWYPGTSYVKTSGTPNWTGASISTKANVNQYCSVEYYKLIATAFVKLKETVNKEGTVYYGVLEYSLLSGFINDSCRKYPELDAHLLRKQLEMFHRQFKYKIVDEAANIMGQQSAGTRRQKFVFCSRKLKPLFDFYWSSQSPSVRQRDYPAA